MKIFDIIKEWSDALAEERWALYRDLNNLDKCTYIKSFASEAEADDWIARTKAHYGSNILIKKEGKVC